MPKVRVAIIGSGYMAEEYIKCFNASLNAIVVGIHSRTWSHAESLGKKYGISSVCSSIEELYMQTKADIVVVAVSELSKNAVCKNVFKYEWEVLIEKPLGYNLADAEDIYSAAIKSNRKVYTAFNRRHYSSTKSVLRDLGESHSPRIVHVYDQENQLEALQSGQPSLVVENWMYANSIHLIDYFSIFCRGVIIDIHHVIRWNPKSPFFVLVNIQYSSGDIGVYEAVWNSPGPWAVSVSTQAKRWEMRPLERATSQVYGSRKLVDIPINDWDLNFKPGLRCQTEELIKAVRKKENSMPTIAHGLATMQLVSKIYEF